MHTTMNVHKKYFILILIIGVLFTFLASEATAQQRNFAVHIPFTGIEMGTEDEVHVDVNLRNMTNDDVDVKLEVERDPNIVTRKVCELLMGRLSQQGTIGDGDEKKVNISYINRVRTEPGNYKFIVKASANGVYEYRFCASWLRKWPLMLVLRLSSKRNILRRRSGWQSLSLKLLAKTIR